MTLDPRLIPIPGTRYVALRDDSNLTPAAIKAGTIMLETSIAALPVVQSLRPHDVVLDIGAFIGDTALIFLDRECRVLAFEPYEDAYTALCINAPTARCFNLAVGDGRAMVANGTYGETGSNCGTRMVESGGVPTLRIDDLRLRRVDFAKIDCEGCEPAVLDGMVQTIERCRPKLLIEVYDTLLAKQGFTRNDVLDRLTSMNYAWSVAIGRIEDDRLDILAEPAV